MSIGIYYRGFASVTEKFPQSSFGVASGFEVKSWIIWIEGSRVMQETKTRDIPIAIKH